MPRETTDLVIRKTITLEAPRDHAFALFTEHMGSWWPLESRSIGTAEAQTAVVEPRAGGRWYECGIDGSECDWGRVIAYEPPARLVLNWQIGADWRYDPSIETELEVRFIAEGETRTSVELEHRGLESYGENAEQVFAIFDSSDGWTDLLDRFAKAT